MCNLLRLHITSRKSDLKWKVVWGMGGGQLLASDDLTCRQLNAGFENILKVSSSQLSKNLKVWTWSGVIVCKDFQNVTISLKYRKINSTAI